MAEIARWQATTTDQSGDVLPFATVEVRSEASGLLVQLYSDRDGLVTIGNPITADANGYVEFFTPGGAFRFDIESQNGEITRTLRYVAIGTAAEYDVDEIVQAISIGDEDVPGIVEFANLAEVADRTLADKAISPLNSAFPPGFLFGLTLTQAADLDHDITIAPGSARDATDAGNMRLLAAITKRIDAAWAVGGNAGGLDTGAVGNNLWYYLWLIKRPDTGVVDVLFSLSATAPTMPTNYTLKRRLPGAVRSDGVANIRAFFQQDVETFLFTTTIEDVDDPDIDAAELVTLTVPPNMSALFRARMSESTFGVCIVFQPTVEVSASASLTAVPGASLLGSTDSVGQFTVLVDANSQIRVVPSAANQIYAIWTRGFIDRRWRQGL